MVYFEDANYLYESRRCHIGDGGVKSNCETINKIIGSSQTANALVEPHAILMINWEFFFLTARCVHAQGHGRNVKRRTLPTLCNYTTTSFHFKGNYRSI